LNLLVVVHEEVNGCSTSYVARFRSWRWSWRRRRNRAKNITIVLFNRISDDEFEIERTRDETRNLLENGFRFDSVVKGGLSEWSTSSEFSQVSSMASLNSGDGSSDGDEIRLGKSSDDSIVSADSGVFDDVGGLEELSQVVGLNRDVVGAAWDWFSVVASDQSFDGVDVSEFVVSDESHVDVVLAGEASSEEVVLAES